MLAVYFVSNLLVFVILSGVTRDEGGGPPRVASFRGWHPNGKKLLLNLQRTVGKRGLTRKKVRGDTLLGEGVTPE